METLKPHPLLHLGKITQPPVWKHRKPDTEGSLSFARGVPSPLCLCSTSRRKLSNNADTWKLWAASARVLPTHIVFNSYLEQLSPILGHRLETLDISVEPTKHSRMPSRGLPSPYHEAFPRQYLTVPQHCWSSSTHVNDSVALSKVAPNPCRQPCHLSCPTGLSRCIASLKA